MKNRNNLLGALVMLLVAFMVGMILNVGAEVPSYDSYTYDQHGQRHVGFAILMGERIALLGQILRQVYAKDLSLSEAQRLHIATQDFAANLTEMVNCVKYNRYGSEQCRAFLQDHLQGLNALEAELRYRWSYIGSRMAFLRKFNERQEVLDHIEQAHYCLYKGLAAVKEVLALAQ